MNLGWNEYKMNKFYGNKNKHSNCEMQTEIKKICNTKTVRIPNMTTHETFLYSTHAFQKNVIWNILINV